MPDISMCDGTNCPWKDKCYRFTAKPSSYQTYFSYPPGKEVDGKFECEYFSWDYKARMKHEIVNRS